ncbi:unnamed protein product [Diamesa hyperborea]
MVARCPGIYCGRISLGNDTFGECGSCPRGSRVENYECLHCEKELEPYDWLFLGFSYIVPLLLHLFLIDFTAQQRKFSKQLVFLYLSAMFEVTVSAILTIFLTDPKWSFKIHSCGVKSLSDWYTWFFNPSPNYETTLVCTQEAVYPLQTIILVFYVFCVTMMIIMRPIVNNRCHSEKGKLAIYYGLYVFPLLALIHTVAGGLIYFAFPYLSIMISCAVNANHFAIKLDQSTKHLLLSSITEIRNVIIILSNWLLFSFGIISIKHFYLLLLTPLPSLFYILTAKYTNPDNFS